MTDSSKEREILMVMRKVLGSIVRDTTPAPGFKHPLSDRTIEDIRMCFGLISARERELADEAGAVVEKPYFVDEAPKAQVISISTIKKGEKSSD
jgi:hypothetical protein